MAQYGRPIADHPPALDIWSGQPWWSKLDETVASDADYIESATSQGMRVKLSPLLPPGVDTGHILRVRTGKASGSTNGNLYIENAAGNVRASLTPVDSFSYPTGFVTQTWNLTSLEASAILDSEYPELYVRAATYGAGARISWIELEIPDASPIDALLSDALELSLDADTAKTVQPELADEVTLSMLAPGLNDPERLIDAGRMFRVTRTRFSPKERSTFIDFEDL